MKVLPTPKQEIQDAFVEIIEGRNVKRVRHSLHYEGIDWSGSFIETLEKLGYLPATVDDIAMRPGERVPAFLVADGVAFFGWIFWEQFTSWKIRKLWGSVMRNERGDWAIQIPPTRPTMVFANRSLLLEMDIDHPSEF